jgi:hypothetical protein
VDCGYGIFRLNYPYVKWDIGIGVKNQRRFTHNETTPQYGHEAICYRVIGGIDWSAHAYFNIRWTRP